MFKHSIYAAIVVVFMATAWILLDVVPEAYADLVPSLLSLPTILLVDILERAFPARDAWRRNHGDRNADLLHTFLLFPVVLKISQFSASVLSARYFGFTGFYLFPAGTPVWAQFIAVLLVGELIFYWVHRLSHETPILWSFHRIHHGAERVYYANAGRFHPVDLWLIMTLYFVPFYAIAMPLKVLLLFVSANVVTGLLEHANIDFDAGVLNYLMNSAQLHRWHHSCLLEEANQNYGKVLCVWDHVFGTWYLAKGSEVGPVGLSAGEAPVPPTLIAQGVAPFVRSKP